jgi:hypothetical protein
MGIALALPFLIGLPASLAYQGMLGRDLARPARVPLARQAMLAPALQTLTLHSFLVLAAGVVLLRLEHIALPALTTYGPLQVSAVAIGAAVVLLLLFLLAIALPYRSGLTIWRAARLDALAQQQADLAARLERFAPEPANDQDIAAIQYDVARLQYLTLQEQSVRRERRWPFGLRDQFFALVIVLIASLLLENGLLYVPQWLK